MKSYEVDLPEGMTPEEGLELVRSRAGQVGIRIEGNPAGGTFAGMAEGRYTLAGKCLVLTVEKKPPIASWGMVRSGLVRVFGEVREVE